MNLSHDAARLTLTNPKLLGHFLHQTLKVDSRNQLIMHRRRRIALTLNEKNNYQNAM